MYRLKCKASLLCRGIRIKCFFLWLGSIGFNITAVTLFVMGIMCCMNGTENIIDGIFNIADINIKGYIGDIIIFLLFLVSAFFFVCASAFYFTLKAEGYFVTDRNQSRPKSFLSLKSGTRLIHYNILVFGKKLLILIKYIFPFIINLIAVYIYLDYYGADRISVFFCVAFLMFSLFFSLSNIYIQFRRYDMGIYLMYLNVMLPPYEALLSSEEKTEGKLFNLAVYKLMLFPKKLVCVLILPAFAFLPFCNVFTALICEKLYGENKKEVKIPAVTFYINKRTKMTEVKAE